MSKHVVIVDDDEAIRHSTSFMLRHAGYSVKTFPSGTATLSALPEDPENTCVLLDVRMPDMDGITVLKLLRERGFKVPIIILTGHGDVATAVTAMKTGATDFLEKPYSKGLLLQSIEAAFELLEAGQSAKSSRQEAQGRLQVLTKREHDILARLADGLTNKAIANDLGISPRTVEIHRANVMAKLNADSLSTALKIAFAAGLG